MKMLLIVFRQSMVEHIHALLKDTTSPRLLNCTMLQAGERPDPTFSSSCHPASTV